MFLSNRHAALLLLFLLLIVATIGLGPEWGGRGVYAEAAGNANAFAHAAQVTVDATPTPNSELPTLIIASNVEAQENAMVTVPIAFYAGVEDVSVVVIPIDFDQECLVFDDRDENGDGTPDAIRSTLPSTYHLFANFSAADTDGELDLIVYDSVPPSTVRLPTTDPLITIDFWTKPGCAPAGGARLIPVIFSSDPAPSFGSLRGTSIPGNSIDGSIYLFGPTPLGTGTPTHTATPTATGTAPSVPPTPMGTATPIAQGPTLRIAGDQAKQYVTHVRVPIAYQANGQAVSSMVFSIDYDPSCLGFFDADSNHDGLPDHITSNLPDDFTLTVDFDRDDTDGEIDFIIFDAAPPLAPLPDLESLVVITFSIRNCDSPGETVTTPLVFSSDPAVSFGGQNGNDVAGNAVNGAVVISIPYPTPTATAGTAPPCFVSSINIEPVLSPTDLLTQTLVVNGFSGATIQVNTGYDLFDHYTYSNGKYYIPLTLRPNQIHALSVYVDYDHIVFSCDQTFTRDRFGNSLLIIQVPNEDAPVLAMPSNIPAESNAIVNVPIIF